MLCCYVATTITETEVSLAGFHVIVVTNVMIFQTARRFSDFIR